MDSYTFCHSITVGHLILLSVGVGRSDLEKQFKSDPEYRKERKSYLIRKFNTFRRGTNKKP